MTTPRRRETPYIPSPADIRRSLTELRREKGIPEVNYEFSHDATQDYERERMELAKLTPAQLKALESEEAADGAQLSAEAKVRSHAEMIVGMAKEGDLKASQRAASVAQGSPVSEGREVPHYRAHEAVFRCKQLLLLDYDSERILDVLQIEAVHRASVARWLESEVRARLVLEVRRRFAKGERMEVIFAHYFKSTVAPQKHVRFADCRKALCRIRGETMNGMPGRSGKRR